MLRDSRQVALNGVVVACQDNAERYRHAAALVPETPLGRLFEEMAAERAEHARSLAQRMRAWGELPDAPDTEWETLERALTLGRATLGGDLRETLVEESEEAEHRLIEAVDEALVQGQPREVEAVLQDLRRDARQATERLKAAQE